MFLIVVTHFVGHNILSSSRTNQLSPGEMNYFSSNFLFSISVGAVSCFVIISGYFQIKFSLRKLVLFVLPIIFYEFLFGLLFVNIKSQTLSLLNYWFVRYYLALMIMSPIINYGLIHLKEIEIRIILILSFVFFILPISSISGNRGMNIYMFILMYIIGYYIRNYVNLSWSWGGYFLSFLCSVALILGETIFFHIFGSNNGAGTYSYNRDSIFVVASAIFLFMSFVKMNIKSKAINWISSSCFYVYIITENINIYTTPDGLYDFLNVKSWENTSCYSFKIIGYSLIVFSICIFVDKLRCLLFGKLESKIGKYIEKSFNQLFML